MGLKVQPQMIDPDEWETPCGALVMGTDATLQHERECATCQASRQAWTNYRISQFQRQPSVDTGIVVPERVP